AGVAAHRQTDDCLSAAPRRRIRENLGHPMSYCRSLRISSHDGNRRPYNPVTGSQLRTENGAATVRSAPKGQPEVTQPVARAIAKPITEKSVEQVLLIRLQHLVSGHGVDAAKKPAELGRQHFSQA